MIKTRFNDKRQAGEPVMGFNLRFPSPELAEFMGHAGFDYAFVDAEHFAYGIETVQSIVRAAGLTGMAIVMRVPKNDPAIILEYLETGVLGIVVPHTKTKEDAARAVDAARYHPSGNRGVSSHSRAAGYGFLHAGAEYYTEANKQIVVITLLEDEEGINNVDEILEVEGVDCVDLGPGDLAMSMGLPDQSKDPKVQRLLEQAKKKILASDKSLVVPVTSADAAIKALSEGAMFIEFNLSNLLTQSSRDFLSRVSNHT